MNGDLTAARAFNKQHQYEDAETLMRKDIKSMPLALPLWLELGTAELGLRKYDEAEEAFQKALAIDTPTVSEIHREDYYAPADPGATHVSRNMVDHAIVTSPTLAPDVAGAAYSGLAEVHARTGRTSEATQAWDTAAKVDPARAALYLGNAAIIFNQVGSTEAQLAAAEKAIAVDPNRAILYYFKGQGLAAKATIDPNTQKLVLPAGCAEAYQKYLELDPKGKFSEEAREILAAAGQQTSSAATTGKKG